MNAEDLYILREDLLTPEELEDVRHDPSTEEIPTFTPTLRQWILMGGIDSEFGVRPAPEAASRREFERRTPALGATPDLLTELKMHYAILPPVQQRSLFKCLRDTMLRQLISCNGVATMDDLVDILQAEMDSGTPAPVPEWYKYSTVTMGPRKIGYDGCSNRECLKTETHNQPQFKRCSRCKVAVYCGRECQVEDFKARHNKVCKEAAKEREEIASVGKMLQGWSDLSLTGQGITDSFGNLRNPREARRDPAVRERRRQLRSEKNRPKNQPAEGPDPDFF